MYLAEKVAMRKNIFPDIKDNLACKFSTNKAYAVISSYHWEGWKIIIEPYHL